MFNKSIDLIKGFSADICIYNLKQSCSSDSGQFITGLLKKCSFCAPSLVRSLERKVALNHLLGPLDPGSQKYPDVTHSPEGSLESWRPSPRSICCDRWTRWPERWAPSSLGRGWGHSSSQAFGEGKGWADTSLVGSPSPVLAAWRKPHERSDVGKPVVSGAHAAPSKQKPWQMILSLHFVPCN